MFGRRNPDRPYDSQTTPLKSDFDLDMLNDLPDILPPEPAKPATPPAPPPEPAAPAEQQQNEPARPSGGLGPSVTQLLREAEYVPPHAADTQEMAAMFETPPAPAHFSAPAAEPQRWAESSVVVDPFPAQPTYSTIVTPAPVVAVVNTPASPATAPANRARTVAESVIGPDDFFDGRYRSERGVRIQGNARGSIESRQYIYVEAGAQVEADLSAEQITVAGDFTGNIICRGRLEVTGSGKIQGHVETALLVVQEGGAIDGELSMRKNGEAAPAS